MGRDEGTAMSVRAIAAVTGVSPSTAHRDLASLPGYQPDAEGRIAVGRVMGLDGKVRPSRRFDTTARDQRIRELRDEGLSMRAIATEVGCSVGTVHRVCSAPA
ncbi:helix-turn-helix domain-containing protein [Isoptericola sp. NPDC019482]|uniref:helix-turn-helix domain-containing protein n=1 Tax=Isoptericola sp. NPDC019482 TaxID=3154688 RepID=UPI0034769A45